MTSLDQAGESQQNTNEQEPVEHHTADHASTDHASTDHASTEQPVADQPPAIHPGEEPAGEELAGGEPAGGEPAGGVPSVSHTSGAAEAEDNADAPAAEETDHLMEDRTTERPEDALGQEAPGAEAGHPASDEVAEAENLTSEAGQPDEDVEVNAGLAANAGGAAANLTDGEAESEEQANEPAHGGQFMQTFFEDLLRALGVRGSIVVREDNKDEVTLDIRNCPDASLIIGRHGQTVDDLQYLGSLVLNNNRRERRRFMLNVENYRERREESLRQSAITLAHQVAELGQEAVLDPLPPHERRIVHMALVEITEVYTYSEGVEPDRRIVISPRNPGRTPTADERTENADELMQNDESIPFDDVDHSGEIVDAQHDLGALNNPFGETDSLAEQMGRDPTEFGLADEEPASSEGGHSTSRNQYALDGDEPTLPETSPGGASHGGHTGED